MKANAIAIVATLVLAVCVAIRSSVGGNELERVREVITVEGSVSTNESFKTLQGANTGLKSHSNDVFHNTLYDASFRKWAKVYTPYYPWYWNKAQAIAESNLDTNAVSYAGAMGIGQFMPDTWTEMQGKLGFSGNAFDASLNIQAQAYYMNYLYGQFKAERPMYDRYSLTLASYNAGLGNVLKAQSYTNSIMYDDMITYLPRVTGVSNSAQTSTYVNRTWRHIKKLENVYD